MNIDAVEAQDKDAVTEMARRRFQEGVRFFDQKRYEEARGAFLQAYALKRHPAVLLNLAHSEIRSGHPLEAARHFSQYLRDPPANATPAEKTEAEKALAQARSKLGRIQVSTAAGADVLVDGESMGQAPLPEAVDVAPGTHIVEVKLGSRSGTTTVTVTAGHSVPAAVAIEAPSPQPVPALPPAAAAPAPAPAVPPSESPEPRPPVEPQETAPESVHVTTEGREPFFRWLGHSAIGWTSVGVTVAGAGVFIGFEVAANKANDNVDSVASQIRAEIAKEMADPRYGPLMRTNVCMAPVLPNFEKACNLLSDNMDKRDADRTVATIGAIAAGVGLVTTVTAYFVSSGPSKPSSSPQAAFVPVLGPHQSGLAIVGKF